MTPLHLAASVGHHNIVTFFLDKFKVDVLSRGRVKYNFDRLVVNNDFSRKRLLCILRVTTSQRLDFDARIGGGCCYGNDRRLVSSYAQGC